MNPNLCNQSPDIVRSIAMNIPYDEIGNFCSLSRKCNKKVCENEGFWKVRASRIYPDVYQDKEYKGLYSELTWRQLFIQLATRTRIHQIDDLLTSEDFEDSEDWVDVDAIFDISSDTMMDYLVKKGIILKRGDLIELQFEDLYHRIYIYDGYIIKPLYADNVREIYTIS